MKNSLDRAGLSKRGAVGECHEIGIILAILSVGFMLVVALDQVEKKITALSDSIKSTAAERTNSK